TPVITTDRLRLTVPQDSDVNAVFEIHSDPRTYQHRPDLVMRSRTEAVELIRQWQSHWSNDGIGYFVVSTKTGEVIGFAGVRRSKEAGEAVLNLYYRFAPHSHGHGYATEAAGAAIEWAQGVHAGLPIVAVIDPSNTASARLARKLGMYRVQTEGASGDHDLYQLCGGRTVRSV